MTNLEEAIHIARRIANATPENHPDRARRLNNLGIRLGGRYTRTGAMTDFGEAMELYQLALHQSNTSTVTRIIAGGSALRFLAATSDWQQACDDSAVAVELIPTLILRSLSNSDKQYVLSKAVGLARDVTAVALHAGKASFLALSLLEKGRGLLAESLEEIRMDILDLQERHSRLADRFVRLCEELGQSVARKTFLMNENRQPTPDSQIDWRLVLDEELDKVIDEIRKQSGFEDFLLPPSGEEMQTAPRCGPVVVINVSEYRCDALLVEQHQIRCLELPTLSIKEIEKKARIGGLGSPKVLAWLWDAVASPILDILGFTQPPSNDEWPHKWWIPTGLLGKFPLHAAGRHIEGPIE